MGNRMLKESILTSEQIDQLDWFEETMFYRLIVAVDDYGIHPANPIMLSHILFPMKEDVNSGMVKDALIHYIELGLIDIYSVENKGIFLKLVTWENHQRLRESKHKYPTVDDGEIVNDEILSGKFPQISANRRKLPKNAEKSRLKPSRNQVEVEVEEETNIYCTEVSENPSVPPVISIPLNDGSEYGVTQEDVDKYSTLYPAVDVMQELRGMVGWSDANPTRKKTKAGIKKFINAWLSKAQNNGGSGFRQPVQQNRNPYADMVLGG